MRTNMKLTVLVSLFLLAFDGLYAQKLQQDPKLVKGVLKNGLTYYIYQHDAKEKESVLRLFVKAGSLQEDQDQLGMAHFIEHMAFNGTREYSKNEVIEFLESKGVKFGADLNAHTSFDETVYKISINTENKKNLEKAIDIMGNWAFGVTFDSLEVEKERGVVIEEWRSKQGAANRLREQYLPVLFSKSRYAERLPIGKVDVIQTFPRHRIVDFYKKWYRPDLMGVAVVTNQDPRTVEKYIKQHFGKEKAAKAAAGAERVYYDLPVHRDTLFSIVTDKEASSVELSFYNKIPSFHHIQTEEDYKASLMRGFLNSLAKNRFNRVSQLQNDFRDGSLSVSNIVLKNAIIAGGVSVYNDQIMDGFRSFLTEVERINRFGYTKDEIDRLKREYLERNKRAAEAKDKELPGVLMEAINSDFYNGNTMLTREERNRLSSKYIPQLDSLSLLTYFRSLRRDGNTVVLLTAPESQASGIPDKCALHHMFAECSAMNLSPWVDNVKVPAQLLSKAPVSGKIISEKKINEIGVTEWKLSNGVTVYLKPTEERKRYMMLSGFREGGIYAVDSSKYISALFSKAVIGISGAGDFSRRALSQYLIGNSASATLVLSNSREGVVASADQKDWESMFQLLYLKWTQPQMDETAFEQTKRKAIEAANNSRTSPSYEYTRAISKLLKGDDDDYMSSVTAERIQKELRKEDILPVFNSRFGSAKGFEFVLVGSFKADSIRSLIETYLGGLPAVPFKNSYVYNGPTGGEKAEDIVMYAGQAPKSTVNLFYQSNNLKYDYPVIVKQDVLEEVLKVKLRMNLREENSGVYGVGVAISSTSKPSPLIRSRIAFSCAPEAAEFLITQAKNEIAKVASDPHYFDAELARIKVQLSDTYNKQRGKNSFWSAGLRNHFYYGLTGYEYFTNYKELLDKVTAADVSALARKYLVETPCIKAVLLPENFKK